MSNFSLPSTFEISPIFLLGTLILALILCCSIVLNRKNLLPLRFIVFPLYLILLGVFFKFFFARYPLEIRLGITSIFGLFSYIYASFIFPWIFNFSFFQWFLYLFLRIENFRLENKNNAAIWALSVGWTIPFSTVWVILYFKLDPGNYISFMLSLWALHIILSRLIAFFMNPELEGFQFVEDNQKFDKITWEDFIRSMSIVSMHYFKKPIKNCIGFSRSKFPLVYLTKRPIFIKALTKVATVFTDNALLIGAGSAAIGAFTGVVTLVYTVVADNQAQAQVEAAKINVEAAKVNVEAAKISFETAKISGESQERVAKINFETAKINAGPVRYEVDKDYSPWWWFKKVTPKPENTAFETVSNAVSEIIERV